jgi:hypothetical protein
MYHSDLRQQVEHALRDLPELATREQVRAALQFRTARTIDNLIARGELDAIDAAGRKRIPRTSVVRYLLRGREAA